MKIYRSYTHVDFEAPVQMTESQKSKFIEFMTKMFPNIELINVWEASKTMGTITKNMTKWTVDDYLALLGPDSNEQIGSKTGKSDMSIIMKRGSFVPDFYSWMNSKEYKSPVTKEIVEEYLKVKGMI